MGKWKMSNSLYILVQYDVLIYSNSKVNTKHVAYKLIFFNALPSIEDPWMLHLGVLNGVFFLSFLKLRDVYNKLF